MSENGKVFRVIIQGEGLDLMGAFAGATMDDWRALIMDTGRGSSAVKAGIERLERTDTTADLSGNDELALIDTITDLVFLAKRRNGGRLHWQEVSETLPYFEVMKEFGEAFEAAQAADVLVVGDPTTAPTDTGRGDVDEAQASPTP